MGSIFGILGAPAPRPRPPEPVRTPQQREADRAANQRARERADETEYMRAVMNPYSNDATLERKRREMVEARRR